MKHLVSSLAVIILSFAIHAQGRAQDSMQTLLKKLDNKERDARFDAFMQLADLGPKAAPATDRLVAVLTKFDEQDRVLAVVALGKIGTAALPALEKLLAHEDELTRHDAAWALGLIGKDSQPSAVNLVRLLRDDPDEDVRIRAVHALAQVAPNDAATRKALAKWLRDDKTPIAVRIAIVEQLRHFGEPAIPALGEALQSAATYDAAQQSLAHLLQEHPTPVEAEAMRPFVVDAYLLAQRAPRTLRLGIGLRNWQRAPLVSELCDGKGMSVVLTHVGAKLMPALEAKLRGKDTGERQAAIYVLGQMGRTVLAHHDRTPRLVISMAGPPLYASPGPPEFTERVVKTLLPMLRHDDYFTRSMTAGNIPVTKATEPALAAALFDADLGVRMLAANSLGGHGQDRILQRLQTGKGIERIRAASLRLPDFAAVNALVQGLSDKDGLVRQESAIIVGLHPEIANFANDEIKKIVVPILREALKSDDPIRRRWSIEALTTQGAHDETSVPALIAALKDKYLRGHALQALRARADKEHAEIVPAVAPFLSDPDPSRRLFAIQCVGNAGKPGLPTLLKALDHEKDRALRDWIIDYLQQQHQDERAVAALLKMADNQEDWAHAMQALLRVGEDEKFPRIVEILCKKEEPVRLTLGRMPKALASTGSRAGPALAALLKRDDLADNRRAACTLELFLTMLWADASPWTMATEQALQDRLPRLKTLMQSKDVAVRREVAATVAQIEELQKRVWFHITRRTPDRQRRDEVMSVYTGNRERINDLLDLARQDTDLQVRRIARKAMRMDH